MAPLLLTYTLRCYYRNQRLCSWIAICCAVMVSMVWYLTSFGTLSKYSGRIAWDQFYKHSTTEGEQSDVNIVHVQSGKLGFVQEVSLFGQAQCILLNADPYNSAVKKMLKDFGRLECRGKEQYSTLSGNVLTVKGKGVHGVTYRGIRVSNDPEVPFSFGETKQALETGTVLSAGRSGGIAHFLGKCFHPYRADTAGTKLILYSDCDEPRFQFRMDDDGTLKHVKSGLCIIPKNSRLNPGTQLVLGKDCGIAKYRGLENGFVQHQSSGLCIHLQSSEVIPPNGADVILYNDCKQNMQMRFSWKDSLNMKDDDKDVNFSVNMDEEFVEVNLVSPRTLPETQDQEYGLQITPKLNIREPKISPKKKLNILMVMFHSTSTAHFKRKMPKSYTFLKSALKTIFVPGFSTIDESTKSQLTALLAGVQPGEMNLTAVDSMPWLFKIAKDNGYVTLMSEDKPYSTSMHSDTLTGFQSTRPDHYALPFWAAVYRTYAPGSNTFCIGKRAMHNISLSYVQDFFTIYSRLSKFALLMNTEVSSWNINALGYVDDDFHQFLDWMKEEGHMKRTLLVVFSDHGSRSHNVRETLQGKLEERMPYLSISLPSEAPKDLAAKFSNLAENVKGLVNPYDVYKTLRNVLKFPKFAGHTNTPGQNLFDKMDLSVQTCDKLKIPSHWCPCLNIEKLSVNDGHLKAAQGVVEVINRRLEMSKSSCANLEVAKLRNVAKLMPNSDVLRFKNSKDSGRCINCEPVYNQAYKYQDFFYVLYIEVAPGQHVYRSIVNSVGSDVYIHPQIVLVEGNPGPCTLE